MICLSGQVTKIIRNVCERVKCAFDSCFIFVRLDEDPDLMNSIGDDLDIIMTSSISTLSQFDLGKGVLHSYNHI